MLAIQDVMGGKLVVQMGLAPKERVRALLRQLEHQESALDLYNLLHQSGEVDEEQLRKLRSFVALYAYVRRESLYLRSLEKAGVTDVQTVRKLVALIESEWYRRRIGDVLLAFNKIDAGTDSQLRRKVDRQVRRQDEKILERYRREDFAGVGNPLVPARTVDVKAFRLSEIFRGKRTQSFVRERLLRDDAARELEASLGPKAPESSDEIDFGNVWTLPAEVNLDSKVDVDTPPPRRDPSRPVSVLLPPPVRGRESMGVDVAAPTMRFEKPEERRIGGYQILEGPRYEALGQAFYKVAGPDGQTCSLQSIDPRVAPPSELARFDRQVEVLKSVTHEGCLTPLDTGRVAGQRFMVLPILEGQTVAERLQRQGAFPMVEAFEIADRVLGALDALHEAHIVVRGLGPHSVFLLADRHAHPVITDFRLAWLEKSRLAVESQAYRTRADELLGRPAYMAPEALANDPLDARTDLYSFGILLFEMLTGTLPLKAPKPEDYINEHLIGQPYTLAEARPDVSWAPELEAVIAELLAKSKGDRPESAKVARQRLAKIRDQAVTAAASAPRTIRHDPKALVSGIFNEFFKMDFE